MGWGREKSRCSAAPLRCFANCVEFHRAISSATLGSKPSRGTAKGRAKSPLRLDCAPSIERTTSILARSGDVANGGAADAELLRNLVKGTPAFRSLRISRT